MGLYINKRTGKMVELIFNNFVNFHSPIHKPNTRRVTMLIEKPINGEKVIMNVVPSEGEDGEFVFNYANSDSGFSVDTNTDEGEQQMKELLATHKRLSANRTKVKTSDLESRFGDSKKKKDKKKDKEEA